MIYLPVPWYRGVVGFSMDNPSDYDVPEGGRTRNYTGYLAQRFFLGSGLTLGTDYQLWTTDYNGFRRGRASLFKFFAQFNF